MSGAKTIGLAVLVVSVTFALSGAAHAATFGANVIGSFPPSQPPTAFTVGQLRALRGTGATVARSDTFWATAEPQPPANGVHTYDWTYDDAVVSTLAQAGLRWQPIIDYATSWAANGDVGWNPGVAPAHVDDYAAYAGAFAARYGRRGSFWALNPELSPEPVSVFEIWNEPDLGMFWSPTPDLQEYATLFLKARAAIKAVDPGAKAIIGGLIRPVQSLPALIAARPDLWGNVDGVAVHPYWPTVDATLAAVAADLQADASTVGAPLYVNEFGWQVDNNPLQAGKSPWQGASEATRDAYIEQLTARLGRDPFVADVEPYRWGSAGPTDGPFDLYRTPASDAFAAGIASAEAPAGPPVAADRATSKASIAGGEGRHTWSLGAIKKLLRKLLPPNRSGASILASLKRGGYTCSFAAPSAGRLVISWYLAPSGARLAKPTKSGLLASGAASFPRAGVASVTIRLTARGKRDRPLTSARSVRLLAAIGFHPTGSRAVRASGRFTLLR